VRFGTEMTVPVDHLEAHGGEGYWAHGGPGYYGTGGHGTVFVKAAADTVGNLFINGFGYQAQGETTTIPPVTFGNMVLRDGVRAVADEGIVVAGTLRLGSDVVLTHSPVNEFGLQITATALILEAGSTLDVLGRGYPGGGHSGFDDSGATLGNQPGAQAGNGASHGGLGGHFSSAGGATNPLYGNAADPNELGSGGGSWGGDGGNGGGRVRILSDSVVMDGTITANGGDSYGSASGDGSGGSINLQVGALSGTGTIHASGGGHGSHTGAGGGRIAIHYSDRQTLPLANLSAPGGSGYYDSGQPGTVYVQGP
jgi:hypothetical protein